MAMEWLSTLGLNSLVSSYYHEVSFGEQRLILLARAMVKKPKILILDEPCVGLDDNYRQLILNILDLIAEQTHTNLIYVSHVKDEKPRCINVHLSFERVNDGSFRIATHSV
jgi:molybdate transport system ATP-binding protein